MLHRWQQIGLAFFAMVLIVTSAHAGIHLFKHPVDSAKWTNKYDRHFKKYSKRYFGPLFDWHWFKAQAIAESGLNDKAKSHMGAVGLMQILPSTFGDITKQNPYFDKVDAPRWNIAAGIYYDKTIYRKLKKNRSQDKLYKTFASYNAGYGRILNAEKRLKGKPQGWKEVEPLLPRETRGYVYRIRDLMGEFD